MKDDFKGTFDKHSTCHAWLHQRVSSTDFSLVRLPFASGTSAAPTIAEPEDCPSQTQAATTESAPVRRPGLWNSVACFAMTSN